MSGPVFVLPCDIRHGEHLHCADGVRRFCLRTGIDFAALMAGRVTADELETTGQHMGIETAKNARERARHEEN